MQMGGKDTELIQRCLREEQSAFGLLYDGHAGWTKAYFLRCGFASADADDLTQAVFVRIFKSLRTFDPRRGSFCQWLAAITRNVARKQWRRRKATETFDPELAEEMLASPDNPGAMSETREELGALHECIASLPAELAHMISLRYVEGRTTRGIAAAADMPEATVRLRLNEARDMLRQCLQTKGFLD